MTTPQMIQSLATQDSPQATTRFGSGNAVQRVEDQLLLLGAGKYTNDVSLPGQSHLVFLRSPYPHAKIVGLDTQAAKAMPGVHGVLTGQELLAAGLKPMARPMNFKRADGGALSSTTRHILATATDALLHFVTIVQYHCVVVRHNSSQATEVDDPETVASTHGRVLFRPKSY